MRNFISRAEENLIPAFPLSLRAAVAAGLALIAAQLLRLQHPLYAMATQTPRLALRRFAGTLVGGVLGALISTLLPAGAWAAVIGIFAGMFASHLLYLQGAARVAGYVCGIVLLDHGGSPWSYAFSARLRRRWESVRLCA